MSFPRLTLVRASRLLTSGLITSEELCSYCHALAVAGEDLWHLNAFTRIASHDSLLEHARASDERRKRSSSAMSPLEGIPVSVKANLAVATEPLTAASAILGDDHPCGYDADVVQILLRQNGAILIGITNMDEFGMGSLGTNVSVSVANGSSVTRNPLPYMSHLHRSVGDDDLRLAELVRTPVEKILEAHTHAFEKEVGPIRSAGGSSCGSAVSVAHGSSLASLGTDTGGSVRLPAAWCHVVGLKPSYGLLSRHGVVSYASSMDTVGILTPTVDCATVVLDHLAQRESPVHRRDSTASFYDNSVSSLSKVDNAQNKDGKSRKLEGIRVGIPSAFSVEECPRVIQQAWANSARWLQSQGATIHTITTDVLSPEMVQKSLAAYYVLASAEASSNLSRYDGFRYGRSAPEHATSEVSGMTELESHYAATRTHGFGREVARRILCGTSVLSSDRFHTHYEAATRLRAVLTEQLQSALTKVDVLLIPTAISFPASLDEAPDSTEMFANDVMTVPISLAGLPSVSVPVKVPNEHHDMTTSMVGLQLVGSRLCENLILNVARELEQMDAEVK